MSSFGILVLLVLSIMALRADASFFSKKSSEPTHSDGMEPTNKYLDRSKMCGRRLINTILKFCGPSAFESETLDYGKNMGSECCHNGCTPFQVMESACPFSEDEEFQKLVIQTRKLE